MYSPEETWNRTKKRPRRRKMWGSPAAGEEDELCEMKQDCKEREGREQNVNRVWRINATEASKQHFEIKLERFPPECGEKGGYNYKIEGVIQKKTDNRDHTSPRKKSEKLDQKQSSKRQLTKTSFKANNPHPPHPKKRQIKSSHCFLEKIIKWHLFYRNILMRSVWLKIEKSTSRQSRSPTTE